LRAIVGYEQEPEVMPVTGTTFNEGAAVSMVFVF
jgi:hypothetical protein